MKARYQQLIDQLPLALYELDTGLEPPSIVAINAHARRLSGLGPDADRPLSLEDLFPPGAEHRLRKLLDEIHRGASTVVQTYMVHPDGSTFAVRVSASRLISGEDARMVLAVEDIRGELGHQVTLEFIDEDRRRIAHELHDVLAQNLAALGLHVSMWHEWVDAEPERLHAEIDGLVDQLRGNVHELRRAIFALRPAALEEDGFVATLSELVADRAKPYGLESSLEIEGSVDALPATLELPLLRITQEALNNIGRHAAASEVRVFLAAATDLTLRVCDDGSGFDPSLIDAPDRSRQFGLRQLRERAIGLGGGVVIASEPGQGTEIRVTLPLAVGQDRTEPAPVGASPKPTP